MIDTEVGYTPDEICAVLESLHDGIRDRFRWSVTTPEGPWRALDFEIARASIDQLVQAYSKTMMLIRSWPTDAIDPEFVDTFSLPDEVWDLLAEITNAKDWDHVPQHEVPEEVLVDPEPDPDCAVCRFLTFG